MKLLHLIVYLPATILWIGFVITWKIAHKIFPEIYSDWHFRGVNVENDAFYTYEGYRIKD